MECTAHATPVKMEFSCSRCVLRDRLFTYHFSCWKCRNSFETRLYVREDQEFLVCPSCGEAVKATRYEPSLVGAYGRCPNARDNCGPDIDGQYLVELAEAESIVQWLRTDRRELRDRHGPKWQILSSVGWELMREHHRRIFDTHFSARPVRTFEKVMEVPDDPRAPERLFLLGSMVFSQEPVPVDEQGYILSSFDAPLVKAEKEKMAEAKATFDRARRLGLMFQEVYGKSRPGLLAHLWQGSDKILLKLATELYARDEVFRQLWDSVKGTPPSPSHVSWLKLWTR